MTNLPNLPPVTDDDVAKSTFAYWHRIDMANPGKVAPAIRAALDADRARLIANGHATEPTPAGMLGTIDGPLQTIPEPTEPAPLVVLPTVDEIARELLESEVMQGETNGVWDEMDNHSRDSYLYSAAVVLDLFAARVPHWERIEPGTVVKAGTRYRTEGDVWAQEKSRDADWTPPTGGNVYIDPRTVPAEPEDPGVQLLLDWYALKVTPTDADAALLIPEFNPPEWVADIAAMCGLTGEPA